MSDLRSDMSGLCQIYRFGGRICPVKLDLTLWKSRSGAKTVILGSDKLTTYKLNIIELREIRRTTRSNLITRNHT
jgi:hypothetical protein